MEEYKYIGVPHCDFTLGKTYEVKSITNEGLLRVRANDGQQLCKDPIDFELINPKVTVHKEVCEKLCKAIEKKSSLDSTILFFYNSLRRATDRETEKEYLGAIARACIVELATTTGSPRNVCSGMTNLYEKKNHDYGDSFSEMRKQYDNAILIRIFDKYSRLKTLLSAKEIKVKEESINDTIFDLANYCIMELVEMELEESSDGEA